DPNPAPPPGAASETFVKSNTTVVIAVPTITTTVIVAGATITLAPGGTPVNDLVPPGVSQPGAVTPTWNNNMIPPASASSVTFTAPPSYTTVVAVPTASDSPPKNITAPPGAKNKDGDEWWLLLFGALIGGFLPANVGIVAGTTPIADAPDGWTGPWINPVPMPAPTPTPTSKKPKPSHSASSSASSSSSCPRPTGAYNLPDDSENLDWANEGTDPDRRRHPVQSTLLRRENRSRFLHPPSFDSSTHHPEMQFKTCDLGITSQHAVELKAQGAYYTIGLKSAGGVSTANRIQPNVWDYVRVDGSDMARALINCSFCLQLSNMVWVDKPLNQGKLGSNVINDNKADKKDPPQKDNMSKIKDFGTSAGLIQDAEYFARNFAALGSYFDETAAIFQMTALRVQNLLSEITPDTPAVNLPVAFNIWLRNIVMKYPAGCTSRATHVFDFYKTQMDEVKATTGTAVPACFPLYHQPSPFVPQTFTWQHLVPPAPTLPSCNFPGTPGRLSVRLDSAGSPVFQLRGGRPVRQVILGSGNTDYYALGPGPTLSTPHYSAFDMNYMNKYPECKGVWLVSDDHTPEKTTVEANIALDCNNRGGNRVIAPFVFVIKNQQTGCTLVNSNDGSHTYLLICAHTPSPLNTCAQFLLKVFDKTTAEPALLSFHPL
ncbi:hypothetical protein DFH09DRAFT_912350, partial [Mycena vulgaris]